MAPTWRFERPDATTMLSAMAVLPSRLMATTSSALASSSCAMTTASNERSVWALDFGASTLTGATALTAGFACGAVFGLAATFGFAAVLGFAAGFTFLGGFVFPLGFTFNFDLPPRAARFFSANRSLAMEMVLSSAA